MRRSVKLLAWLAAAVLVFGLATQWVLVRRAPPATATLALLFEDLRASQTRLAQVRVTYGRGMAGVERLTMTRQADGVFLADELSDYPADAKRIADVVDALVHLAPSARRTAVRERHARLGLVAPENVGSAIQLELLDGAGARLAGILIGKTQRSEAPGAPPTRRMQSLAAAPSFYVRRIGEAQTYLVKARLAVPSRAVGWLAPSLPRLTAAEVRRIGVRHRGASLQLRRDNAAQAFVRAEDGEELPLARAEALFQALRSLRFERVNLAANAPPPPRAPSFLELEAEDGTRLEIEIAELGPVGRVRFQASGSARADAWQARYNDWIYAISWATLEPLLLIPPRAP